MPVRNVKIGEYIHFEWSVVGFNVPQRIEWVFGLAGVHYTLYFLVRLLSREANQPGPHLNYS